MTLNLHAAPAWLPLVLLAEDDTEESVMGSDLHQQAIGESHAPLFDHAAEVGVEGRPAWYVSSQVTIIATLPRRQRPWQPKPDVFVVPGIPAHSRTSYDTRTEGPAPSFVLEVASDSTWRYDVGEKGDLYELIGVQEYLVFDPTGEFLGEQVRGWHRAEGTWQPWLPERRADGQAVWTSDVLGLAARPEGLLLRFDHPVRGTLPVRRDLVLALERERRAREEADARATDAEARATDAEARAARSERELADARAEIARLRSAPHPSDP